MKHTQTPIATCSAKTCIGCPLEEKIQCHFSLTDWSYFLTISLPPFLLGGAGILRVSGWLLIPWLLFAAGYFGFIEIRVMCSHCPHYAEPESALACWANRGSPKLWAYRPGPMSAAEKTVFLGGFVVVWGYPLVLLVAGAQVFLLVVYALTTTGFFWTLKTAFCTRCMNMACPLNSARNEVREAFFERNPSVAGAWGRQAGE